MADSTLGEGLTIQQLEALLAQRRRKVTTLLSRQAQIEQRLEAVKEQIRALGGVSAGGNAVRARNAVSLVTAIEQVLSKSRKPMRVGEITEKVLAGGYRSTSPQFRAIVNQTLIKEKGFVSAGRGIYRLKK
jgi:hypothetical protein